MTQFFFDNKDYFEYVKRLRKIGVTARIIPGILPITDYQGLKRFCGMCGTAIPKEVDEIFAPIQDNKEELVEQGIRFAIRQCQDLLANGAPGLHFYTLNKISPTDKILPEVRI